MVRSRMRRGSREEQGDAFNTRTIIKCVLLNTHWSGTLLAILLDRMSGFFVEPTQQRINSCAGVLLLGAGVVEGSQFV